MSAPALQADVAAPPAAKAALLQIDDINDELLAAWSALADEAAFANPYYCEWFLPPLLKALGSSENIRLLIVKQGEQLVGLAPVEFGAGYAKIPVRYLQSWKSDHIYSGAPLIRVGAERAFLDALRQLLSDRPDGARFLRLCDLPSPAHAKLQTHSASAGLEMFTQKVIQRAFLSGDVDFETAYANSFTGKKRKELRRQWRRLGETGAAELRTITDLKAIAAMIPSFLETEMAGWKGASVDGFPISRSGEEKRFFIEAMTAGAQKGAVRLTVLSVDENPVSQLYSLRHGGVLSAFKITYDETLAAFSPGVHVLVEAMRDMLNDQTSIGFDSCARPGHPVADSLWRERLEISDVNIACVGGDAALLRFCKMLEDLKATAMRITAFNRDVEN